MCYNLHYYVTVNVRKYHLRFYVEYIQKTNWKKKNQT